MNHEKGRDEKKIAMRLNRLVSLELESSSLLFTYQRVKMYEEERDNDYFSVSPRRRREIRARSQ